jgi:DNA-binding MarR family transcriptional regulator
MPLIINPLDNVRCNEHCQDVTGKLLAELQRTKPFERIEEEAVLNIARTAEVLGQRTAEFLKGYSLSAAQYNLLRILRGAGEAGATCSQIGERMVSHDPDVTRLLDRLEGRELIARQRSKEDRRVVVTTISRQGLELLSGIDTPLRNFVRDRMGRLKKADLESLIGHLEQIRELFAQ